MMLTLFSSEPLITRVLLPISRPCTPNRAPRSRANESVAITMRLSISTWSTGRSITAISSRICATFFGMSLIISVLVRSSATMRPRWDRKPLSLLVPPEPPPTPRASVSALKMAPAEW